MTEIGCICVTVTTPVGSLMCTIEPALTSRRPTRPSIGATSRVNSSCSFAVSIAA